MYCGLVDVVLYHPPYLIVDWIQVWGIWQLEFLSYNNFINVAEIAKVTLCCLTNSNFLFYKVV